MNIPKEIQNRYFQLKTEINKNNKLYYEENDPELEDYDYDKLTQELKKIEKEYPELITKDSPTQKVGADIVHNKIAHKVPMLSLQDVFSFNDVEDFYNRIEKIFPNSEYVVEMKIDGLSTSERYENSVFSLGITRGDGVTFGDNITENLKNVNGIPHKLKEQVEYLEVRGEVYMSFDSFQTIRKIQELKGEKKPFKNARNAAAGTLRVLDPKIVKKRNLNILIFNLQDIKGKNFTTHSESLDWLREQGFSVVPKFDVCHNLKEIMDTIKKIGEIKKDLPFPIDGAVIKLNSLKNREIIGNTAKYPKWAVAYKYPPEEKETIIRKINVSVGRTGVLTPVAYFDTIQLAGTDVSKATLHNQDQINKLDIKIGDTVKVRKAAEIIPEVVSVVKEKRTSDSNTKTFKIPSVCPVCGFPTEKDKGNIICPNIACPAQFERSIIHFVSKTAMNISGFGVESIDKLIENNYINNIGDIYRLKNKKDELIENGLIGKEKTLNNLIKSIEKSKDNNIDLLITGLGIKNIGKKAAQTLAQHYKSIFDITNATKDELSQLDGVGSILADSIVDYFSNQKNINNLKDLQSLGLNMFSKNQIKTSSLLDNKTFVITGTMNVSRENLQNTIILNGGKITSSVSKKTNYVIAGKNPGSKLDKANKLGIQVITEENLKNMLNK